MPTTPGEWIGLAVAVAILLGYLALHVIAARRLGGAWKVASFLPLPILAVVLYGTINGIRLGSNLTPLPLIVYVPTASLYLAVLILLYAAVRPRSGETTTQPTPQNAD